MCYAACPKHNLGQPSAVLLFDPNHKYPKEIEYCTENLRSFQRGSIRICPVSISSQLSSLWDIYFPFMAKLVEDRMKLPAGEMKAATATTSFRGQVQAGLICCLSSEEPHVPLCTLLHICQQPLLHNLSQKLQSLYSVLALECSACAATTAKRFGGAPVPTPHEPLWA